MVFLNLLMLAGTLAAAVPAAMHLWARSRPRPVPWAAMHLLSAASSSERRRMKTEQLLLLLLRILIPVAMALLMARATVTGGMSTAGSTPLSLLVLFDDSASLQAPAATEGSRQQAAQTSVGDILAGLPRGSEATVVPLSGLGQAPALTADLTGLAERLRQSPAGTAGADVPRALAKTADLLPDLHHLDRLVLLVSDFQNGSWSPAQRDERQRLARVLTDSVPAPRLVLLPIAAGPASNLVVESITPARTLLGPGQPVRLRVDLRAFGPRAFPSIQLVLMVDGVKVGTTTAELTAGGRTQALFTHAFAQAGSHVVEVVATADGDAIAADNIARLSLPVTAQVDILQVSGNQDPAPLASETAFLDLALAPPSGGAPGLLRTTTIGPTQLTAERLAQTRVVVLANVRSLDDGQVTALTAFVRAGGGLLVFPGERIDSAWYNRRMGELLPASFGAIGGLNTADGRTVGILSRRHDHPALALFDDPANGSFAGASIRSWFVLTPTVIDGHPAAVPAQLDTGAPLLVERTVGAGRVLLCATGCTPAWSNLPLRPSFVPLMQELVAWLAATVNPPRNLAPGEQLAALLPAAGGSATVTDPAGIDHQVTVAARDGQGLVTWDETRQPGVYVVRGQGQTVHLVVQGSASEWDPQVLVHDGITALADELGATVVDSAAALKNQEAVRRSGHELWPWFWGLLLVLLLSEIAVMDRLAGRTTTVAGARS